MHGRQSMHEIQNEAIMISMSRFDSKNPIIKTNKDLRRKKIPTRAMCHPILGLVCHMHMCL